MGRPYVVSAIPGLLSADVVLLQENWRPHGGCSVAEQVAAAGGYDVVAEMDVSSETTLHELRVSNASVPERGAWGLAVLSRIPLVRREDIWLGTASRDVSARGAQVVELGQPGAAVLRLVNVHLTNRLSHGPGQLLRLRHALSSDEVPTVVAGDFNMCRPTIYLARGYRPAVRGRTWPARRPVAQLDHILVSRDITIAGGRTLGGIGSDHLPVRVELAHVADSTA